MLGEKRGASLFADLQPKVRLEEEPETAASVEQKPDTEQRLLPERTEPKRKEAQRGPSAPRRNAEEMKVFLKACLRCGVPICIAGRPDSGKEKAAQALCKTVPNCTTVSVETKQEGKTCWQDACAGKALVLLVNANSSENAGRRLEELCQRKDGVGEVIPILAYCHRGKITHISQLDGQTQACRTLYQRIDGQSEKLEVISEGLQQQLLENGLSRPELGRFLSREKQGLDREHEERKELSYAKI